jgi:pimeloyl-ACP methyl ester carboxylesterase
MTRRIARLLLAAGLTACLTAGSVSAGAQDRPVVPTDRVRPAWAGAVLSATEVSTAAQYPAGTRAHRIRYLSTTPAARPVVVTGLVLVPPGPAPEGGRPVIAWGHGTTGIGDDCAPSLVEGAGAYYGQTLARFLTMGFAVAATDYPRLGTPGEHPYLVPEPAARSVIDSVVAARRVAPRLSTRWLAAGHSQGGQAAMATAEIADDYDAGLRFGGAVVYAPAPNMAAELDQLAEFVPIEQAFYTMMLVGQHTQHPELRYADYLGPRARALLPAARTLCFDDLAARFEQAQLPGEEFVPRDDGALERLRGWFTAAAIGQRATDGPVLIAQGDSDQIVPRDLTDELVAASRGHGSHLDYRVYPGADHGGVLDAAAPDTVRWLTDHTGTP